MYRIRLASGAETTYHSMDELASALQGGTVTAEAVIYHQRADRWLSIANHPHYQIALSRASSGGTEVDASKRQVISAVRPEVPPTVTRPQAPDVSPESENEVRSPRKLTIPAPRKPEAGPLRAHENVLEGVVINRPNPVHAPSNGHANGNGAGPRTTALPIRSVRPTAKPPAVAPEPKVPDLGEGLDLAEGIMAETPAPVRSSTATPEVDKLLEMLEPAYAGPVAAKSPDPVLLDLKAPLARKDQLPAEAPDQVRATRAKPELPKVPTASASSPAKPRRSKVIGMAAGAVLVMGAAVLLWKPWSAANALPQGSEIASTTLPRTEAFGGSTSSPAPTTAQITGSEMPVSAAPFDSARGPVKPVDSAPAIVRVAAPRNISVPLPTANLVATSGPNTLNISAGVLIQHYNAAFTEARSELELRMLQIGFTQIFLRSRLATGAGVQDTRRLIASAGSALRQYRSEEIQIERAYGDTVGVAGRNLGWTTRDLGAWNTKPGQRESGETLRLTNLMLSQLDSTFSLLAGQEGKFRVSGEIITFQNTDAAQQYGALRSWLNQQADKYSGSGDALPATLRQVIKAIGSTRLPQERR